MRRPRERVRSGQVEQARGGEAGCSKVWKVGQCAGLSWGRRAGVILRGATELRLRRQSPDQSRLQSVSHSVLTLVLSVKRRWLHPVPLCVFLHLPFLLYRAPSTSSGDFITPASQHHQTIARCLFRSFCVMNYWRPRDDFTWTKCRMQYSYVWRATSRSSWSQSLLLHLV